MWKNNIPRERRNIQGNCLLVCCHQWEQMCAYHSANTLNRTCRIEPTLSNFELTGGSLGTPNTFRWRCLPPAKGRQCSLQWAAREGPRPILFVSLPSPNVGCCSLHVLEAAAPDRIKARLQVGHVAIHQTVTSSRVVKKRAARWTYTYTSVVDQQQEAGARRGRLGTRGWGNAT